MSLAPTFFTKSRSAPILLPFLFQEKARSARLPLPPFPGRWPGGPLGQNASISRGPVCVSIGLWVPGWGRALARERASSRAKLRLPSPLGLGYRLVPGNVVQAK